MIYEIYGFEDGKMKRVDIPEKQFSCRNYFTIERI